MFGIEEFLEACKPFQFNNNWGWKDRLTVPFTIGLLMHQNAKNILPVQLCTVILVFILMNKLWIKMIKNFLFNDQTIEMFFRI